MFFRFTALMRRVRQFCVSDCGAGKCWRSSAAFRAVWSGWKHVRRAITRELRALGHEVRLMPAQYVKAYIKRNKHDAADAEAICEAVGRPTMRFVPVKTAEQQATALLHRGREQLVRQRTMLVNALRAHLAEFGIVAARGLRNVGQLIAIIRDDADIRLPAVAQQVLQVLASQLEQI